MKVMNHQYLGQKLVEINYDACGKYNINSQIEFKTTILKSTLFDCRYAYILVKETVTVVKQRAEAEKITADRNKKKSNIQKLHSIYQLHK